MTLRDQEEQDGRIDQVTLNIEKMRTDMRWETKKFILQIVIAAAALAGGGAALGNYLGRQGPPQTINVHLDAPLVGK